MRCAFVITFSLILVPFANKTLMSESPVNVMKKLVCSLVLLACAVPVCHAQGSLEAVTSFVPGSVSGPVAGTVGWTFQPLAGIQVTDIGCLDFVITDQGPITIGFWNSAGTLLASGTVYSTNTLVGQTRYLSITPFFLSAGQTYTLGAYSSAGVITVSFVGPPPNLDGSVTLANNLQLGSLATSAGGFTMPNTLGPAGSMCLGPNFRFLNVPEPSTIALLLLGAAAMRFRRRPS